MLAALQRLISQQYIAAMSWKGEGPDGFLLTVYYPGPKLCKKPEPQMGMSHQQRAIHIAQHKVQHLKLSDQRRA